jgi:hypothetical protein
MSLSMRSAGGALACLLTLHLSLIAGDPTCGGHEAAVAASQPEASAEHAHHEHVPPAAERSSEPALESCRSPSSASCCEAMASCQVQIAFVGDDEPLGTFATGALRLGSESAPASSALSPELPPPKA